MQQDTIYFLDEELEESDLLFCNHKTARAILKGVRVGSVVCDRGAVVSISLKPKNEKK